MEFKSGFDQTKELAYDLRQGYAKLVGEHLIDIAYARKERNYPKYFKDLEDLYTIIAHKISDVEEKERKNLKKDEKEKYKNYEKLRSEFIKHANDFPQAYAIKKEDKNPEHVGKIEGSLRAIERYLYRMMDKAKMFGGKGFSEGLG